VPTKSDPDYPEPLETFYAENGVRYMHATVLSEPEDTPDITGVTFVMTPAVLVTVRYDPASLQVHLSATALIDEVAVLSS
jgi:magnesium transporter